MPKKPFVQLFCDCMPRVKVLTGRLFSALLPSLLFLVAPAVSTAFVNGGDQIWTYRDKIDGYSGKPGKQNPVASVTDTEGNVIISGSQLLPGGSFEEIYTVKITAAGALVWRGVFSVPGLNARAVALALDSSGNVYVTGVNDGSNNNIHTIRYNKDQAGTDATPAWQQMFDGGGTDKASSITVSGNSVYVGGSSRFGGNECFMVLAYNKESGSLSWQIPNASKATTGKAASIAADGNGVAVTGQSWSGPENFLKTISYSLDGQNVLWQTPQPAAAGYQRNDSGLFVKIDSKGHTVVSGSLYNGLDTDIHTVKYCSSSVTPCDGKTAGDILWQETYDGGSDDEPNALQIESGATALDNVYVTGHTLLSGRNHIYTASYKSAAATPQTAWNQSPIFDSGGDNSDIPAALVADPAADNLFVVGYSTDNSGNSDFRTVKYRKSTGDELWSQSFHGIANSTDRAVAAGLDQNGHLNVVGYSDETAPLDSGISTATAGTKATLVNSVKAWQNNAWTGYYLMLLTGANNIGQFRQIQSSDATTLSFSLLLPDAVGNGDGYYLYDKDDYDYYVVKYDKGVLNAPTKLRATAASNSTINLVWQDNNATTPKFRVEQCQMGTDHYTITPCNFDNPGEINVLPVVDGATTTQATGLTPDKYYYFRVRAYTGSDFSSATQVTYPSSTEHAVTQTLSSSLAAPSKTYSYAGVANSDDYALTIATGPKNGHPVVSGKSLFTASGFDYYTIRLDKDNLTKLWSQRYDGSESQTDSAMCLTVDTNDQVVVSGYSWLNNLVAAKDMNSIYTIKYKVDAPSTPENDSDFYDWAHQYNGAGAVDDRPIAIAAASDNSNNIAVVGMGIHAEAEMSNHDIYVLHYPSAGPGPEGARNPGYWAAATIDKGGDDEPTAVAIDPSGNVVITGLTMNTTRSRKDYDIYIAKFAAATGTLLWEKIYDGGYGDDEANSVATDADGNVYVTGFTTNDKGDSDFITIKYDKDGNIQWGGPKLYDGPAHGDDEAVSVKVDPIDNHLVVSGNRLTDPGNNDVHVIRYAPDGSMDWQKTLLREHNDEDMFDMVMDTSGSVYITSTTTNSANPDPQSNKDILTIKLDWKGLLSPDATLYGLENRLDKPFSIAANYQGDVFVAGITQNDSFNADYIVLKIDGDAIQSPYPISYTTPSYSSVTLGWTDVSKSEDGYQVARRDGICPAEPPAWTPGEIITTGPGHLAANTVTFTDSGLASRATYCYGVRSFKGASYSRWANKTVTMATPAVPLPVTANPAGTSRVTVSWTPQNNGQQTGFELWRCNDTSSTACSDFSLLPVSLTGIDASYDDTAVCGGTVYRYKLKAKGPGWVSDFSTAVGAIPSIVNNIAVDPGFEAPNPMTAGQAVGWTNVGGTVATDIGYDASVYHGGAQSLLINAVGTTSISGIKQYVLFSPGGKYQLSAWFKTTAAAGKVTCDTLDGSSFLITNSGTTSNWEQVSQTLVVTSGTPVTGSRLRCYAAVGTQAYIDDLQMKPLYDLTATRYSETEIDLAWIDSAFDESGYRVERCSDASCLTPQSIAILAAGAKTYHDHDLTPDTAYWYRVRPYKTAALSCNGGWNGDYSNIAGATTTNTAPALSASSPNTTRVNLVWSDTAGTENQFRIERCSGAGCVMSPLDSGFPLSVSAGSTGYIDTAACNNTPYNYRLRAEDHGLELDGGQLWQNKVLLNFGTTFKANTLTRMTITPLSGMDAGFKDIRFYDETESVELPYWIEDPSVSPATVWFKTGDTNTIFLYFGNDHARSASSAAEVFGDGLIGSWLFNDAIGSATAIDTSGLGNNGILNAGIPGGFGIVAAGKYGNGFSMEGTKSYTIVPDTTGSVFDINGSHSVELWYQYQPSESWARVISKPTVSGSQPWDLYGFYMDNTVGAQNVSYRIVSGNTYPYNTDWGASQPTREAAAAGPAMIPGNWYHLVGRYDYSTGRLSLFVNGVEYFMTATPPFQIPPNNEPFTIGSRGTYGNYTKGIIDEVRIFNRALTDQEIASRYAATPPVVATPNQIDVSGNAGGFAFPGIWDGPYSATVPIVTPKPVNLVTDPDFDNGSASWATAINTATGTSFDTAVTYSGSKSLKLTASNATLGLSQSVPVVPNSEYTLSAYLKTAFTSGTLQCDLYSSSPLFDSTGISASGTSGWSYKTETVTIPGGVTSVSVRCFANGGPQGQAWIDMVQLVPSLPISAFTAARKSEAQVDLTWTFPTGRDQTGFKIDRCGDSLCAAATPISVLNAAVSTTTPGNYKYSDKSLTINTSYWYRVSAYKTEDPSCNGAKGYWETAPTGIAGPVETTLKRIEVLTVTPAVTTDCEDLRLTDSGSGVAQKFYLENSMPFSACNTLNTKLIVKIPSIPTAGKTLNLYHGNLKANRVDDGGTNVFTFFDDFNGTAIDASKWLAAPATGFSVAGGYLHGTNTSGRLASVNTTYFGSGYNLQAKVKSTQRPGGGFYPIGFSLYDNQYRSFGLIAVPTNHYYSNDPNWTINPTTPPAGSSPDDSMIYSVLLKSSTIISPAIFDVDKNLTYWAPGDVANSNHSSNWNITLGRRYDATQLDQPYLADWDWVRIRKYVDNAPVAGTPGVSTPGTYAIAGESGSWSFLRQVAITNASGAVQPDYQVNIVIDTTSLATDRNTLVWSAATDTETGFTLERCKNSVASCTTSFIAEKTVDNLPPKNSIGDQVKYSDRDLQLDSPTTPINYCYRVKALKSGGWLTVTPSGETDWSNIVCASTKLQAPPTNLQATNTGSTINLSWTDNSTGESGFNLERCKAPCSLGDASTTIIKVPPNDDKISTAAAYADSNLCSGTYRYRISTYKDNPDATAWTLGPFPNDNIGIVANTDLPPTPVNVTVTRISEKQTRITWTDKSPDEAGFEVWRCLSPAGKTPGVDSCTNYLTDFVQLPIPAGPSTSPIISGTVTYSDSYGLIPGGTYRYMVKAYTSGSCGIASDPSPPNALAPPNGPDFVTLTIDAPTGATATAISTTQVDLAWTDRVVSESGYAIGRCSPAPCSTASVTFQPLDVDAATYSDTAACAGTAYTYSIYPVKMSSFINPGSGGCWKSYSQLTFTDFKPNFITQVVITRDPSIVDGTEKKADFSDIRFLDYDAMQELPFWIQGVTGNTATVWVKTGLTDDIDLYFGNPLATYNAASSKDAVFGSGLGGYWPFEETTQLPVATQDASGSGNSLTMNGFAAPDGIIAAGGVYGNALSLDGIDDYANKSGAVPGLPAGTAISAEAWIYPKGGTFDYNGIIAWGARGTATGYGMSISISGYPQMPTWGNDFFYTTSTVNYNSWNHIAIVADGTTYGTIYLNGVKQRGQYSSGTPRVPNIAATDLVIGSINPAGGARYFSGLIDEVRTYSRVLTDSDITSRYAANLPRVVVGGKNSPGGDCLPFPTNYTGSPIMANAVTEAAGNLAKNVDFENDLTGWKTSSQTGRTVFTADSAVFFSGKKSAKLTETNLPVNNAGTLYQTVTNIVAGGRYILSGYINASLGTGGLAWCSLTNGEANIMYGSPSMSIAASDLTKNNMGWIGFNIPITIPAVTTNGGVITYVNLECGIRTTVLGTQTAYFDAVQLVPDPPLVLTVPRKSEAEVYLKWIDFPAAKSGFNVYRCNASTTDCSDITTFPNFAKLNAAALLVDNYLDTAVTVGQTYKYVVKANKAATCGWEIASNVVSAGTNQVAPVLATPVLLSSTSMKLDWSDTTTSETGYNIYRCTGSGCEPAPCVCSPTCVPEGCSATTPTFANQSAGVVNALNNSLKVNYTFNNTMNDSSGNQLHITPGQPPVYDDGGVNLASFCGDAPSPVTDVLNTDEHTISFDIKYNAAVTTCDALFRYPAGGTDRSPGIWACGSNRLYWRYDPGDKGINLGVYGDNSPEFEIGRWYRIRGVKSGSSFKAYVDDLLVHSSTILPAVKKAGSASLIFGNACWKPTVTLRNFKVFSSAADPATLTFTDSQICPETTYNYKVEPVKNGTWTGLVSNAAGNTTSRLNQPAGLSATTTNDVQINLVVTPAVENEQSGFMLKECPGTSCTDGELIPNNNAQSRIGLTPETNYCYQVASFKASAYCNSGAGLTSPYISAASCQTTHTARAGNLAAKALNSNKILLEWDDLSENEDKFLIQKKIWNGQWAQREVSDKTAGKGTRHSFIDTIGIEPLKKYTYRIVAVKGAVESPPSNEAVVTYTDPNSGQTIYTTPAFTGGMEKATCICTTVDGKDQCK